MSKGISVARIIPVLLVVPVFLLAWKLILPNYFETKTDLAETKLEVDAVKEKFESLEKTEVDLDEIQEIVKSLLVAIPEDSDEPNLISELEAISLKHELIIPSIGISASASNNQSSFQSAEENIGSSHNVVMVSLTVKGSFDNLREFISSLEKSVRFMNIDSISMVLDDEESDISLALQIKSYAREPFVSEQ